MFLIFKATQPIYTIPRTINSSTLNFNNTFLLINSEFRTDQYLFGFEFFGVAYTYTQTNYLFNMTGINKTFCNNTFYTNSTTLNATSVGNNFNISICQKFNNLTNVTTVNFVNSSIQTSYLTIQVKKFLKLCSIVGNLKLSIYFSISIL